MTESKQSFYDFMDARTQNIHPGSVYQVPELSFLNLLLLIWSPWFCLREYVLRVDSQESYITNNAVSQRTNHRIWVMRHKPKGTWYSSPFLWTLSNLGVSVLVLLQYLLCGPFALIVYVFLPKTTRDNLFLYARELDWVHNHRSSICVPQHD